MAVAGFVLLAIFFDGSDGDRAVPAGFSYFTSNIGEENDLHCDRFEYFVSDI